jgi:ADP-heptose:LPS heptosyltransferase
MGDVLLTTPVVHRLRNEMGPDCRLDFSTLFPEVYRGNPDITSIYKWPHSSKGYDRIIDLDLCYERKPSVHIIDAYSEEVFGRVDDYDKSTRLFPTADDLNWAESVFKKLQLDPLKCVVVNMSQSEYIRTWPKDNWINALHEIVRKGFSVIVVGGDNDFAITAFGIYDLSGGFIHDIFGNSSARLILFNLIQKLHLMRFFSGYITKTTIQQISALISKSGCFLSSDAGLLHVAGTTATPIVGIFTSVKGEYRVPYRNGAYGGGCIVVSPQLDCYGCRATQKPPITTQLRCKRGDYNCKYAVTVEMVVSAVERAMHSRVTK